MSNDSKREHPELATRQLPDASRQLPDADLHAEYRASVGAVSSPTAGLPVPVQVVVDHDELIPLGGGVAPCNQRGNPHHNARVPIFFWYQETPIGPEIYVAFYTGPCRWSRCSFCTLPSESSPVEVSAEQIILQALLVFDSLTKTQLQDARRLFLSNNGSILDPETMPPEVLRQVCELAYEHCPNMEVVCLETRIEYCAEAGLTEVQRWLVELHERYVSAAGGPRAVKDPAVLQLSIGYETQDPFLRNAILWKGYDEADVQAALGRWSALQRTSGMPLWLDEYIMLKPAVGLDDQQAIAEATQSILHLQRLSDHFGLVMHVRLNPTFAAVGSELYLQFQQDHYRPPSYRDVVEVLRRASEQGARLPIFIGLNDEGLSYDEGSFGNRDDSDGLYRKALQDYNRHQNVQRLLEEAHEIEDRLADPDQLRALRTLERTRRALQAVQAMGIRELASVIDDLVYGVQSGELPHFMERLEELVYQPEDSAPSRTAPGRKVSRT